MVVARTEAQEAADAEMERAMVKVCEAYGWTNSEKYMLGDYLALVQFVDMEHGDRSNYIVLMPGEGIPWHRIDGLHARLGKCLDQQERDEDN
jgi:hypothetical protein